MPEGEFPEPPLVTAIKNEIAQNGNTPDHIRDVIVPQYPESKYVDMGSENIVLIHPDDPDKIVKYRYDTKQKLPSPIDGVSLYHMHRVLSLLYPQHFPRIYSAKEGSDAHVVNGES